MANLDEPGRERVVEACRTIGEFLGKLLWEMSGQSASPREGLPPDNRQILLSPSEAAALLGVSRKTLHRFESDGRIQSLAVGTRRRYARSELERFVTEGGHRRGRTVTPIARQPSQPQPAAHTKVQQKGAKRKPNEADRYAARTYGLNLRALNISGPQLQEILQIDSKQYKSWAYEGGHITPEAMEKFDTWCVGFVESIRKTYPGDRSLLIDTATTLE